MQIDIHHTSLNISRRIANEQAYIPQLHLPQNREVKQIFVKSMARDHLKHAHQMKILRVAGQWTIRWTRDDSKANIEWKLASCNRRTYEEVEVNNQPHIIRSNNNNNNSVSLICKTREGHLSFTARSSHKNTAAVWGDLSPANRSSSLVLWSIALIQTSFNCSPNC